MIDKLFEFPEFVETLSKVDIPVPGCTAYLIQGINSQVLFMKFSENFLMPSHSHSAQWGIVLSGSIELEIKGKKTTYTKGDNYFIPEGTVHSCKINAGYSDITVFNQPDRYSVIA